MTDSTNPQSRGPWALLGRILDKAEYWFIVLAAAGIVVLVFAGVLSRFVFEQPMAWSEELARYLFLWAALVGAASACRNNQHGGIPLLVDKFSAAGQRAAEIFVTGMVLLVLGVLAWQSVGSTQQGLESGQTSLASGIPIWVINGVALIAYLLAILRTIQGYRGGAYHARNAQAE
ncbi:MAG: TRAP transporter small permease [Burkholderiaceae bacterium]